VVHGLCHCRIVHLGKGHRLRRCLPRRLHPSQEEHHIQQPTPGIDEVPQFCIDPVEYIDCRACVPVCPVSAIFSLDDLPDKGSTTRN
jgi:ferredoxin